MGLIGLLITVIILVWLVKQLRKPERFSVAGNSPAAKSRGSSRRVTLYYADWCPYCKSLKPVWNQLKATLSGQVTFAENDEDVRKTPGIASMPTIILESNGRRQKHTGARDYDSLRKWILTA